jgi:hypothetical protein
MFIIFLVLPTKGFSVDFYDANQVNTIQLYFPQSNWDQLLDNLFSAGNEDRLLGTAIINGVTFDSVGVRYKGNSSYNASRLKNPLNIKLNYMIENQLLDGKYGTIKLANGFSDPSFVRETLGYEIARKYMPASMANYANVYVNDVLIGAYTNVQDVDSYFMQTLMHCDDKPRFKCDTNTMSAVTVWGYLGADSTAYSQYYGIESDYGWTELIHFANVLNNDQNNIATVLNVDQNLWMCAFDNLVVSLDSPINIFHNFYLFGDASGRFNPILWDLNMTFGGFGGGGGTVTQMQQYNPLQNSTSTTFPIISHVISNARYKKMFLAHMRTMLTENFSNNWYSTRAAELQAICGPSVQADPHFFYTYANFQANLNSSVSGGSGGPGGGTVPGITQLMNARATYLLSSTAFQGTVPVIAAINHSPEVVVQNIPVTFTLAATNATYAQLGIRQNIADKFTYYQMYDDGAHGDGASNDGVFGVTITPGYGEMQYYGYAENSAQGTFLPARAEHEFLTLSIEAEPGDLYINEIMANNLSFPDPNSDLDDWVELYNPTDNPIDIGGMYMCDSHYVNGISAWTHIPTNAPTQTTISAHSFLVVWFDEETTEGPLHMNNKLGASADAVYLIDSDGVTVIDTYTWTTATGLNIADVSIGRLPDGGPTWVLFGTAEPQPCTPGAANDSGVVNDPPTVTQIQYSPHVTDANSVITISASISDADNNLSETKLLWGLNNYTLNSFDMTLQGNTYSASVGPFPLDSVIQYRIKAVDSQQEITLSPIFQIIIGYQVPVLYINEIMPSNTSTIVDNYEELEDWVEIYNPSNTAVNLAGYYLLDSHYFDSSFIPDAISSLYPDSTFIPAHGYRIFWFDEDPEQGVLHINSKLGITGDGVYLLAPDMMTVIDSISWTADLNLASDQSYGRHPDGSNAWMIFGLTPETPVTPGISNGSVGNDDHVASISSATLSIYPNPCSDHLNIEVKNSISKTKVSIYNIRGQLVKEYTTESGQKLIWDITDKQIPCGLYLVKVTSGNSNWVKKICLVR